jgi:ABC-2 type transport system permease protein
MFAILKKELNLFFVSPIGYLVIAVFLLVNGLFLWVFKSEFNILNTGFADLNNFFFITPWFFIFFIPAITMRSFSDEIRMGTIEIIKTKPITNWQIIIGKYLGSFILILLAIIPTLTYVYTIIQLTSLDGKIDFGSIIGSYLGLLFLTSGFTAIGLFTSTLSNNQIVAFILGVAISFFMFYGFEAIAELIITQNFNIENIGMASHYKSISRGVIDTKDLLYFLSITFFFLFLTKIKFDQQ